MFVRTSGQRGLFEAEFRLGDKARGRLKSSWAEHFHAQVLPVLLEIEPRLAGLYSDQGRPTWSVARMLGLCLLRELRGLGSDQSTVDALAFDLRFQHALGLLDSDSSYLSRRSLVDFRRRLAEGDPEGHLLRELFDRIGDAAIRRSGVSTSEQRVDSTIVHSNIAVRGRKTLVSEAFRVLLKELDKQSRLTKVPAEARRWFSAEQPSEWDDDLLEWFDDVLQTFRSVPEVANHPVYRRSARVFAQQVEPDPDDEPPCGTEAPKRSPSKSRAAAKRARKARRKSRKRNRMRARPEPDSLRSMQDPDCRWGHKGLGYLVHIAETCHNEGPEFLTDVGVVAANRPDRTQLTYVADRLAACGRTPKVINGDGGYCSAAALHELEKRGIVTRVPVHRSAMADDKLSREDFDFNEKGHVVACPQGNAPCRHLRVRACGAQIPALHAYFDVKVCNACPRRSLCPVTQIGRHSKWVRLNIDAPLRTRDRRYREQDAPDWKSAYRIRAGVEATMSELKRAHAMGRVTVRGMPRVRAAVFLKATACNIKRWDRAEDRRKAA